MTDSNANNPRKTEIVIRSWRHGILGHTFSRPLTPDEGNRLSQMIERHGSCLFTDKESGLAVGMWGCTCSDCETELAIFVADTKVTMTAQAAGDKSFIFTGDDTVKIEVQQIGAADHARFLQTASVASQVATQIAAEVSAAVASKTAQEVANLTVAETLGSVRDHAATGAKEPRLVFHHERPN